MEPLTLPRSRLSRHELIAAMGGSFAVHLLVFAAAIFAVWSMPHKPVKPPFCTVNLVTLKDLGTGHAEPKGNPKAVSEDAKPSDVPHAAPKAVAKSGPMVPVKRLQLDEAPRREEAPIRKIEPREAPKLAEMPQSMAAVDKNLDKMIPKPKRVSRPAAPAVEETSDRGAAAAQRPSSSRSGRNTPAAEPQAHGSPTGSTEAGARGGTPGSIAGSMDGSTAASALVGLYAQKVREVIEREWRVINDPGLGGLKAVIEVQIRKNGEIINIQVVKPSGNTMFDDSAVRAVRKAEPLPAVPEVIVQPNTKLRLTFQPGQVSS